MARVAVVLKLYPESPEIDLEALKARIKERLPEGYSIEGSDEEPIAFGLKALKLIVSMPEDVEGGTETLESLLMSIDGVGQVEVEVVQRMG